MFTELGVWLQVDALLFKSWHRLYSPHGSPREVSQILIFSFQSSKTRDLIHSNFPFSLIPPFQLSNVINLTMVILLTGGTGNPPHLPRLSPLTILHSLLVNLPQRPNRCPSDMQAAKFDWLDISTSPTPFTILPEKITRNLPHTPRNTRSSHTHERIHRLRNQRTRREALCAARREYVEEGRGYVYREGMESS
jgi:hypothetical protein